jgi:hypothetical protein
MKLVLTLDFPNDEQRAATLEAFMRDSVTQFNRSMGDEKLSVYRSRVLTDARYRELFDRAYAAPRSRAAWVRRWMREAPGQNAR